MRKTCSLERSEAQSASMSMKPVPFTSLRAHGFILLLYQALLTLFLKRIFNFYKIIHSYDLKKSNCTESLIMEASLFLISVSHRQP